MFKKILFSVAMSCVSLTAAYAEDCDPAAMLDSLQSEPTVASFLNPTGISGPIIFDPSMSVLLENQISGLTYGDNGDTHYSLEQIKVMFFGLAVKGAGGGGALCDGLKMLEDVDESGVTFRSVDSVVDDEFYIVAGAMGSPAKVLENLDNLVDAIIVSANKLVEEKGGTLGGILSIEAGPVNSVAAMLVGQRLGVPVIDADGVGRSIPTLKFVTYDFEAFDIAPMVLTDPNNLDAPNISHPADAAEAEGIIEQTVSTPPWDGIAGLALWGQTGAELKASKVVRGNYTDAFGLGAAVVAGSTDPDILVNYLKESRGTYYSHYTAKLDSINSEPYNGSSRITIKLSGENGFNLSPRGLSERFLPIGLTPEYTLGAINENMLLSVNWSSDPSSSRTLVTAPTLTSFMVQTHDGNWVPYNNADTKLAENIGNQVYIINTYADERIYEADMAGRFLTLLSDAFDYTGGLVPDGPPNRFVDIFDIDPGQCLEISLGGGIRQDLSEYCGSIILE